MIFLIPAALGIMDLVGVPRVKSWVAVWEEYVFRSIFRLLHGNPYPDQELDREEAKETG